MRVIENANTEDRYRRRLQRTIYECNLALRNQSEMIADSRKEIANLEHKLQSFAANSLILDTKQNEQKYEIIEKLHREKVKTFCVFLHLQT